MRVTRLVPRISQVVGRVVLFSLVVACVGSALAAQGAKEPLITVLNPTGDPPPIHLRAMTERPASLDGKTIYLVSNTFDNADKFLHSVQAWLAAHYPTVKTIYVEKKGDYVADDPDLWKKIQADHALMIMAIGH